MSDGIDVRTCESGDVTAVLELWGKARSEHASVPDHPDDVERLAGDSPARRVTALVAFDYEVATGFWDSAGYPLDREIGRRVRNI